MIVAEELQTSVRFDFDEIADGLQADSETGVPSPGDDAGSAKRPGYPK